jgi:dihydrofolate synthase/folylpolyglutamate synthase
VQRAVERLVRDGRLDAPPTFFECATAIGFELFRRASVRVAVLEVGLGGRLDATNVVDPVAAAITSIDFDHQALLGDTLDAIAAEKAGIARPGIPVVCGTLPPEAMAAVERTCARVGARVVAAGAGVNVAQLTGGRPLALRGRHQQANAAVAACLLRELDGLGIAAGGAAIRAALTETTWPGRLELFSCGGTAVLLDAAHNAAGARALADYLRETGWADATLVFGAVQDKDAPAMLTALAPVCRVVICTTPASPRATPADVLLEAARRTPGAGWTASAIPDPQAALHAALGTSRRVVVAGSIFLIGPLRGILRVS